MGRQVSKQSLVIFWRRFLSNPSRNLFLKGIEFVKWLGLWFTFYSQKTKTWGALSSLKHTHTEAYICVHYMLHMTCAQIFLEKNGVLLLKYKCLSSVRLYKIIRNRHIFVRSSEEKAIMWLCSTSRNLAATPAHLKSIRQCSFYSFIRALAIPSCPPSWW